MRIDLHCHSTASDGTLPPEQLVARAAAAGVDLLALTDHDDLSGLPAARRAAQRAGVAFLDGVEISVTWRERTIHVVGLGIDPQDAALGAGLAALRYGRSRRAERMAAGLAAAGIDGALEGAARYAGNRGLVSRTHFARLLVERGVCRDVRSVFKRYLVEGRPGYVPHRWADLEHAVAWIRGAGGVAVLAHPGRYRYASGALRRLLAEFKAAGGAALEVVSPSHGPAQAARFGALAREFGLLASAGSDFHDPVESVLGPGVRAALPARAEPLWVRMGWV